MSQFSLLRSSITHLYLFLLRVWEFPANRLIQCLEWKDCRGWDFHLFREYFESNSYSFRMDVSLTGLPGFEES